MRELGERRNSIPPEVELTQRQAAGQGRERRDAVDATEEEKEGTFMRQAIWYMWM